MSALVFVKVAELEGPELDYWVAVAQGARFKQMLALGLKVVAFPEGVLPPGPCLDNFAVCGDPENGYCPSSNWAYGGPIIEREKILLDWNPEDRLWYAGLSHGPLLRSASPLVAAMRYFVRSKLGETIEESHARQ